MLPPEPALPPPPPLAQPASTNAAAAVPATMAMRHPLLDTDVIRYLFLS
jgi:hypothetical protein